MAEFVVSEPSIDRRKTSLAEQIRGALTLADALGEQVVAMHLDASLVALTGNGIAPPQTERTGRS